MEKYTLKGTIKEIFDVQTFASGFNKREFVVTTEGKYPQDIKFECLKDKCELLEGVKVGESVTVSFDLSGREWNGKYFVNLNAWRIDCHGKSHSPTPADEVLDEEPPF